MKKRLLPVLTTALILIGFSNQSQANTYFSVMTGFQERPRVITDSFSVSVHQFVDILGRRWLISTWSEQFVAQEIVAAHIHLAPRGENGPVIVDFEKGRTFRLGETVVSINTEDDLQGPLEGMSFDDLIDEIEAGNTYVNLHSPENPAGYVRGQIFGEGNFVLSP